MDITIKDVAKRAGVSIATVSRVINKNYVVSREMEGRVLQAIDELNYYPNSVARSLKNGSTLTIGFVISDISNNYFTTMAKAIEDILQLNHYNVIVCSTHNDEMREHEYLELLRGRKVDGLIINTTGKNDDYIERLSKELPTILVNRKVKNFNSFKGDFIDSDNNQGCYNITSHLLSYGHRKIGVFNGPQDVSTGIERFEGFKRAMQQSDILVDKDYIYQYTGDFTMESGYQGAAQLMSLQDRPTALLVMNNAMVMGALKYLKLQKISIPDEISIASYGNIENIEVLYVRPSIITLDPWVIGNKVGEMIIERISDKDMPNRSIIYVPNLLVGDGVRMV